jgi:hypothetical protein
MFLQNVRANLQVRVALQTKRQTQAPSPSSEPQVLYTKHHISVTNASLR